MAIKANSSDVQVVGTKLYTGIAPVSLEAVNPTLAELNKMGINAQKEPEYLATGDDGTQKVRIEFWVKMVNHPFVMNKVVFFLENKGRVSKEKGTAQYINNFGQNTWALTVEEAVAKTGKNGNTWFAPEGARVALMGEVQMVEFLINILNIKPKEDAFIDVAPFFKGNYKELKAFAGFNYRCQVLFTVRDGKYQSVYNGWSSRLINPGAPKNFEDHAARQKSSGYSIKEDYSIKFQEYAPVLPDVDTPESSTPSDEEVEQHF